MSQLFRGFSSLGSARRSPAKRHGGSAPIKAAARFFPLELEKLEDRTLLSGFATTTEGIHIWMDQLGNLSPQMTQFLATHVDGTQKQTPSQIAALQAINPNFGLLNYRLGTMAGPPQYIINGQWSSDWTTVNGHEDWFAHQSYSGEPQTAGDLASGRIRDTADNSYAMDISNTNWQNYWLNTELQNLQATGANGTFVDSFTYGIGGAGYDAPPLRYQGTNAANAAYWPGGVTWTDQLANWARTIENTFGQYNATHGTDYKFIPNLDARATSWEPNWYYQNGVPFIDGAFLEGFGGYTDTYNWRLSMNRGLDLTRNDKIVIMQPYSSGNQQQLDFLLGTYLLLKGDHTYLAINGTDYYPEYQLNIGAPTTPIPGAGSGVDGYLWNGVYRRDFQNGFVLVNPGSTTYNLDLGGTYQQVLAQGGGALSDGQLDANGNYIGGSLSYQNVSGITMVGGSAAIFLTSSGPTIPAPPANVSANAGDSQVALSWSVSSGAISYNIYSSTTSGGESLLALVSGTSYTNTGLSNGTTYYYQVTAVNSAGESGPSTEVSATPQAPSSVPGAPSNLAAAGSLGQETLSWTAPAGPVASFNVYRGTSSSGEALLASGVTGTTFTDTALANDTTYYYEVTAVNSSGEGALSGEVSARAAVAPTVTGISPASGSINGGSAVTISGSNFAATTAVWFGGVQASSFTINADNQITAIAPAQAAGVVDITVVNDSGTSGTSAVDRFTYVAPPPPKITGLSRHSGPTGAGTSLTISGSHFSGATAVYFGTTAATSFTVLNDGSISVRAPAHAAGTVDVTVFTAFGTSALSSADRYTFVAAPVVKGITPNSGTTAGGTVVTISGNNLKGATKVMFGKVAATKFVVNANGTITAWAPTELAGIVDVLVTTAGGTSGKTSADRFTYR